MKGEWRGKGGGGGGGEGGREGEREREVYNLFLCFIQVADICRELTEIKQDCDEAVLTISRGPSPPPGDFSEKEVEQMVGVPDALRALEDALAQRQCFRAVQLLHTMRKQWKREEVFGSGEEDDVDCLFFIYARYISDRQEGELCASTKQFVCQILS